MPSSVHDNPSNAEIALVQAYLEQPARNIAEAARSLAIDEAKARQMLRRPHVRRFLVVYQRELTKLLAESVIYKLSKYDITREMAARRYWELAGLPPHKTKGSIQGQVDALKNLCTLMQFIPMKGDDPLAGKSPEQLANFAAYGTFDKPTRQ